MRMFLSMVAALFTVLVFSGCSAMSNKSVITEYGADGAVVKVIETSESVVTKITESSKGKTVIAWESGWMAYISGSAATTEDPTPTVKMFAGKSDKGAISALPNQKNWDGIAKVIQATKQDLEVSASGISNTSSETERTTATSVDKVKQE